MTDESHEGRAPPLGCAAFADGRLGQAFGGRMMRSEGPRPAMERSRSAATRLVPAGAVSIMVGTAGRPVKQNTPQQERAWPSCSGALAGGALSV